MKEAAWEDVLGAKEDIVKERSMGIYKNKKGRVESKKEVNKHC